MSIREAFQLFIELEIRLKNGAFKTEQNYVTSLHSFEKAIGNIPAELCSLNTVLTWLASMQSMGHSPNTIKGNLCKLRSVLKLLKRHNYQVMDYRDIDLPSIKRNKPNYLEPEEVTRLVRAAKSLRDKAIIACLYSTGCRVSELLNLNREDVKNREIVVLGKGSKYRTVFIGYKAWLLLQKYLETRNDIIPALFISGQYRRITVSRVEQILHITTAEAGIDKIITPHVLRHSYATNLVRNGASLLATKDLLGHQSIQTTQMYTHTNKPYLRGEYEKYHTEA